MHSHAVRELVDPPHEIRASPFDQCVVLSLFPAARLDAYDEDLALIWTCPLERGVLGLRAAPDGQLWLLDRTGASFIGPRGIAGRIDAPPVADMEPGALGFTGADLVFAYQHTVEVPPRPPLLIRVTPAGTPVWTSSLSSGIDAAELHERTGASSWVCGYVIAGELAISDDAVLAVYKDTSSGLAAGYVFSLIDGRLKYTTPVGPISEVAAIGAGRFLIGSQGYGAFATVEYDTEGREARRWNSHGRYILHRGDVRVIELENVVLSLSRLVRLQADGGVERGDLLEGYYTSEFWIDSDDALYFARDGLLIAARDLRIQARQALCDLSWRGAVTHCLAAGRRGLFVTYTAFIDEGRQASGLHYLSGSATTMPPSDVDRE